MLLPLRLLHCAEFGASGAVPAGSLNRNKRAAEATNSEHRTEVNRKSSLIAANPPVAKGGKSA